MWLTPARVPEVQAQVFAHDPHVATYRNVLYVPKVDPLNDTAFGLYDETGRQILPTVLMHDYPSRIKTQGLTIPITAQSGHPEVSEAIYGGTIGMHYGHFITECLSALWYYKVHGGPFSKIVFHSLETAVTLEKVPYVRDLLRYCGIALEQIIIPRYPTLFQTLIVPSLAFSEDAFCYKAFTRLGQNIGDLARVDATLTSSDPVYLSRLGLTQGTVRLTDEMTIVEILSRAGVQILQPERLSVADQIAVFRNKRIVTGIIGSSFHNTIFTQGARGIALTLNPGIRRTFPLMDAASGAKIDYFYLEKLTNTGPGNGFFSNYSLAEPAGVAETLLREIDRKQFNKPQKKRLEIAKFFSFTATRKPAFSRISSDSQIYRLKTPFNEYLVASRSTGRVYSAKQPDADDVTPVIALMDGDDVLLMGQSFDAPTLVLLDDGLAGPMLPFRRHTDGAVIGLRSLPTEHFLSAPPSDFHRLAFCELFNHQAWESFTMEDAGKANLGGRFRFILPIASLVGLGRPVPAEYKSATGPLLRYIAALESA